MFRQILCICMVGHIQTQFAPVDPEWLLDDPHKADRMPVWGAMMGMNGGGGGAASMQNSPTSQFSPLNTQFPQLSPQVPQLNTQFQTLDLFGNAQTSGNAHGLGNLPAQGNQPAYGTIPAPTPGSLLAASHGPRSNDFSQMMKDFYQVSFWQHYKKLRAAQTTTTSTTTTTTTPVPALPHYQTVDTFSQVMVPRGRYHNQNAIYNTNPNTRSSPMKQEPTIRQAFPVYETNPQQAPPAWEKPQYSTVVQTDTHQPRSQPPPWDKQRYPTSMQTVTSRPRTPPVWENQQYNTIVQKDTNQQRSSPASEKQHNSNIVYDPIPPAWKKQQNPTIVQKDTNQQRSPPAWKKQQYNTIVQHEKKMQSQSGKQSRRRFSSMPQKTRPKTSVGSQRNRNQYSQINNNNIRNNKPPVKSDMASKAANLADKMRKLMGTLKKLLRKTSAGLSKNKPVSSNRP